MPCSKIAVVNCVNKQVAVCKVFQTGQSFSHAMCALDLYLIGRFHVSIRQYSISFMSTTVSITYYKFHDVLESLLSH